MGQPKEDAEDDASERALSQRHRPTSEVRFPEPATIAERGTVSDELRALLWDVVFAFLLAPHPEFDKWTSGAAGRPAVRRVWASAPLFGNASSVPEDVDDLLKNWFSLASPAEVFAFVEAVHDNLEAPSQHRFLAAANIALDRGVSDRRFVARRLMPIASRSDIATIERALHACKGAHMADVEVHLLDALDRFALKPDADFRGAVQEAIRAVEEATFVLTGERPLSLDDALDDLVARRYVDGAIKAAYGGLFTYATSTRRRTTQDDARIIVVMCAGFLLHLTTRM